MANLDTLLKSGSMIKRCETEMAALQGNSDYREMMAAAEQWRARARQYQSKLCASRRCELTCCG